MRNTLREVVSPGLCHHSWKVWSCVSPEPRSAMTLYLGQCLGIPGWCLAELDT